MTSRLGEVEGADRKRISVGTLIGREAQNGTFWLHWPMPGICAHRLAPVLPAGRTEQCS